MDERSPRYEGWRVVAACAVTVMWASAPYQVFALFLKPLTETFSWSRESVSGAYGVMTLVAAVAATPVGAALDHVGARRIILPSLALVGAGIVALAALTASLTHLYLAFAAVGLASIGASPVANSRAVFSWFDAHRGRALGLMLAGPALGGIVLPPALQAVIDEFGWRAAYVAFGAGILGIGLPIAIISVYERQAATAARARSMPGVVVRDALASRVLWTLMAVVFGSMLATSGATVHMLAHLTDRGFPAARAALVLSALGFASLAGRLLTGWLLDRYVAVRVSVAMLIIAALGIFLLSTAHSFAAAVTAALLIGFGSGGETDVIPYLISRYFGMRSLSTLYGLNWTVWGLAAVAGPMMMGRAFDATGTYETTLIQLAFVTGAAALLITTLPRRFAEFPVASSQFKV